MATADFPITGVAAAPNAVEVFPGEHWSDAVAFETIHPGDAVVPTVLNGRPAMRKVRTADVTAGLRIGIALRPVDIPDANTGIGSLTPNAIKNQPMLQGEYVHTYYSGGFRLTVCKAEAYAFGDLVGWDIDGARPAGKSGVGAWGKSALDTPALFEVRGFTQYGSTANVGELTVISLRGQN